MSEADITLRAIIYPALKRGVETWGKKAFMRRVNLPADLSSSVARWGPEVGCLHLQNFDMPRLLRLNLRNLTGSGRRPIGYGLVAICDSYGRK